MNEPTEKQIINPFKENQRRSTTIEYGLNNVYTTYSDRNTSLKLARLKFHGLQVHRYSWKEFRHTLQTGLKRLDCGNFLCRYIFVRVS